MEDKQQYIIKFKYNNDGLCSALQITICCIVFALGDKVTLSYYKQT